MRRALLPLAATIALAWSGVARAGGGAATDAYDGVRDDRVVDVHGLADVYMQANLVDPSAKATRLREFDTWSGAPSVGLLHASLAHAPDVVGFRLDVGVGDLANGYLRSDPAYDTHPDVARAFSYAEQAFVTAVVPIGRGLALDVGKFGTPVGFEENEALTNMNYSRSLLYSLAEPTFHSGLRATYAANDALAVSAFWVNGWNANVLEGSGMRSGGVAASWKPSDALDVIVDYMGGLERPIVVTANAPLAVRHELDFYATYDLTERLSFTTTGDYGRDAGGPGGSGVSWWGVGGYFRARATSWLAGAVRGEHFADTDGFTSGTKQTLAEVTATIEARTTTGPVTTIGRLEYRRDGSDARVFASTTPSSPTHQDTLTLALLCAF